MDWKYKHFNHEAIFKASQESVLEAASAVMAESLGGLENTTDGFTARGYSGRHSTMATFRITSTQNETKVTVELLVERAAMRGYMLFDVGGYYTGQIDKWFSSISKHVEDVQRPILVSKTTSNLRVQRGCLTGCLVYLVLGACLGLFAIPLDRALFPQYSESSPGPFSISASIIGLLAGVAVFLYALYPDAPASKFIRERLHRSRN